MEKMSITRALVQLKRLNDRIATSIASGKFVSRTIGKGNFQKVAGSNDSIEATTTKIQSSYDSVDSLIALRAALKSAIVLSNANTDVSIMGKTMKVAEAIELKSTVQFRSQYLNTLKSQMMRESQLVESENAKLDAAIDVSLNTIYGSEKSKISDDTYKSVAEPQKQQKESKLLDPQKIEIKIKKLEEDILEISSELDFVLAESNAKTIIEV